MESDWELLLRFFFNAVEAGDGDIDIVLPEAEIIINFCILTNAWCW